MANYTQYIPNINSTTYPVSINDCFTALTTDVTALENDKLNLTGGTLTGTLTLSTGDLTLNSGSLTLSAGNIIVSGTVDGRDILTDGTKLDGIEALADVTDTTNVTAAGALMDSEVSLNIKTLSLPANTTISTFGASLVDDADAAIARTTLGLDADISTLSLPANTTISTFGASLVDDADAATARTTLESAASGANTDITSLASTTTATTQTAGNNSTKIATTEYADTAVDNLGISTVNNNLFYLGSGADGAKTVSTSENLSIGEYHYTSLTVNSGQILGLSQSQGYLLIRCTGTVTITGTISLVGKGATTSLDGVLGGSGASGGARDVASVGGGDCTLRAVTLPGGASRPASGDGYNGTAVTANNRITRIIHSYGDDLLSGIGGGAGGGNGGWSGGTDGIGGNGGGCLIIIADTIDIQSGAVINTSGTNGTSDNQTGGGGGGGGLVLFAAKTVTNNGTVTTSGGIGGATTYSGGDGGDGGFITIAL